MIERTVFMGWQWVPESEAKVSIYDLSVMQGVAAFEMTRSFNGVTFKLREHLDRLEQSCRLLGIPLPAEFDDEADYGLVTQLCKVTMEHNQPAMLPDDEHRLLIVVSPGAAPIYREIAGVQKDSWLYIADFPLQFTTAGMGRLYTDGIHASISDVRQLSAHMIPVTAKHRSRAHFHLAQQQAAPDWAILLDEQGCVTEGPGFNLMGVRQGEIVSHGYRCLEGISQQTVEDLAEANGYAVDRHAKLNICHWRTLLTYDELWATGTPFCLLPIVTLNGVKIGNGKPGPIYQELLAAWSVAVNLDIAGQIQQWDMRHANSVGDLAPR